MTSLLFKNTATHGASTDKDIKQRLGCLYTDCHQLLSPAQVRPVGWLLSGLTSGRRQRKQSKTWMAKNHLERLSQSQWSLLPTQTRRRTRSSSRSFTTTSPDASGGPYTTRHSGLGEKLLWLSACTQLDFSVFSPDIFNFIFINFNIRWQQECDWQNNL